MRETFLLGTAILTLSTDRRGLPRLLEPALIGAISEAGQRPEGENAGSRLRLEATRARDHDRQAPLDRPRDQKHAPARPRRVAETRVRQRRHQENRLVAGPLLRPSV